jgi:two-component system response regulator YesN
MITMLVVDDEYYLRLGIREIADWDQLGVELVGDADNGEEGLRLALALAPDIILMDIRMPILNGLELMEKLKENDLKSEVIVLSGFNDFEYARVALNHGALAYLLKPIDKQQLVETVCKVVETIKNKKSTKNYYEKLKGELSSIKRQFLKDLITGNITASEEIKERISFLSIPLEIQNNLVIDIKLDNFEVMLQQLDKNELEVLKAYVPECVAKYLLISASFLGLMLEMKPDEWCIIMHPAGVGKEMIRDVEARCRKFTEEVQKNYSQTFSIGISNLCENIENIGAAYREAIEAASYKFLPGSSSVSYKGDIGGEEYRREIKEVIKYIKNNYYKDITVDSASKVLFISPSYLMHMMKNELGQTFNDCLTDCRIDAAKELLKDPTKKIYEVSKSVGYNDVKYFTRVFRKETGINPSDYVRITIE